MFGSEVRGLDNWRGRNGSGHKPPQYQPAVVALEGRALLNAPSMQLPGFLGRIDPVTLAGGIDRLSERFTERLVGDAFFDSVPSQRQLGNILRIEARLRSVMNTLAAINGGDPEFDRVLTSFRAHDAQLIESVSFLSNTLRRSR